MYPFRLIIVGGSEAERTTIRREVTNLSVDVEHEFDDIDKTISQRRQQDHVPHVRYTGEGLFNTPFKGLTGENDGHHSGS